MSAFHSERPVRLSAQMARICLLGTCAVIFMALNFSAFGAGDAMPSQDRNERYERGMNSLRTLDAEASAAVQKSLQDISPDMGRFIIEFAYGDVFSRPGLDPKSRQVATIAALTALGNAEPQIKFHIGGALNVGVTPQEIVEVIYVATLFSGFPAGLNAISAAREVFKTRGVQVSTITEGETTSRRERGLKALAATSGGSGQAVLDSLKDIAPAMGEFVLDFAYGDVISRQLSPKWKEITMIAAGVARGTMRPQVKVHVKAGAKVGLTKEEIVEVVNQMAVYAGFPAALNGLSAVREAYAEMEPQKAQ
jgi:4-carboxymuconolactone decarboxylase